MSAPKIIRTVARAWLWKMGLGESRGFISFDLMRAVMLFEVKIIDNFLWKKSLYFILW